MQMKRGRICYSEGAGQEETAAKHTSRLFCPTPPRGTQTKKWGVYLDTGTFPAMAVPRNVPPAAVSGLSNRFKV